MRISKKLVLGVLMGVMSCGVFAMPAFADEIEHNVTDASPNPYVIGEFYDMSINITGGTHYAYLLTSGNNDKTITINSHMKGGHTYPKFNFTGDGGAVFWNNGNGVITFDSSKNLGNGINVEIQSDSAVQADVVYNTGKMVFDTTLSITNDSGSNSVRAVANTGALEFNDSVSFQGAKIENEGTINFNGSQNNVDDINNYESGTINFNGGYNYLSDFVNNYDHGIINFNGGVNHVSKYMYNSSDGQILINDAEFFGSYNNDALYAGSSLCIENHGIFKINANDIAIDAHSLDFNPAISNYGDMEIKTNGGYIRKEIVNHGNLTMSSENLWFVIPDFVTNDTVITNYGKLTANLNAVLAGNIIHVSGAVTDITLKGKNAYGHLEGLVYGSDDNFSLTLDNAYWTIRGNTEIISGVNLIDSSVDLSSYGLKGSFITAKFNNLQASGWSYFDLKTDLKNDIGDKVVLLGTTPSNLDMIIRDIDDYVVPISKEDGHKVTVLEAPSNSKLNLNALLGHYSRENMALSPIIEEEIDDNVKKWNFVGWLQGNTRTFTDEISRESYDANLNVRDIDNTFKRLNDLRTDPSEVGVWVRGETGDTEIHDYSYKYNIMAGGYDWHKDNKAGKLFYGLGISYSTNKCDDGLIGTAKSMGYSLYGSWLGKKNNDYVDVILKYGNIDKDFSGIDKNYAHVSGDYNKNLFSIATKYGRRIYNNNGSYIEPQVGYTYGRLNGTDYVDSQNSSIHSNEINSHIFSIGMQAGKKIKGIDYYTKLNYVYDFGGQINVSCGDTSVSEDMGGGYFKFAIGASRKVNANHSFYLDLEKDFGNKVNKPYAVALGYRYTF